MTARDIIPIFVPKMPRSHFMRLPCPMVWQRNSNDAQRPNSRKALIGWSGARRRTIGNANVSLIIAMTDDRVMAKDGGIPWEIPADAARYRRLIRHHIAIFGRKTLDDSYTETENIVITRLPDYRSPVPAHRVHSVDEAFAKAEEILRAARDDMLIKDEVFIIGGGEVFRQTIDRADKLYLTTVHKLDFPHLA